MEITGLSMDELNILIHAVNIGAQRFGELATECADEAAQCEQRSDTARDFWRHESRGYVLRREVTERVAADLQAAFMARARRGEIATGRI